MRVASDIGGTFTDLVYLDEKSGEMGVGKASTTPKNFAEAVVQTLRKPGSRCRILAFSCTGQQS
jgi:N-methylhydantoinase A